MSQAGPASFSARLANALPRLLHGFFGTWRFAMVALSALACGAAALLIVLLTPPDSSALGAFAQSFKVWCFGYNPNTGGLEWAYVAMFFLSPAMLTVIVLTLWGRSLREQWQRGPTRLAPYGLAGCALVGGAAVAVYAGVSTPTTTAGFRVEDLRISHALPSFVLEDQLGNEVRSADLRGHVGIITGIYTSCGYTCPMIAAQLQGLIDDLPPAERSQVRIVAITLDPEHDDRQRRRAYAEAHQLSPPLFRLCSSTVDKVNDLLDRFEIARQTDPKTGVITHANLLLVTDRAGRIAYRFGLGAQQQQWMTEAVRGLIAEANPR